MLASIMGRLRLYSALLANMAVWALERGAGCLVGRQHPLQWSSEQDFNIMVLKTLFTCGTYVHWRNFMKLWRWANGEQEQKGLKLVKVPPETFGVPGCRSSWWLSLDPSLLKDAPPAKASCVLMFLHGGAFMAGDPRMYCPAFRHWMQQLAAEGVRMRVLSVGYPLAPEHPYPAAILAVAAAYRWLVQQLAAEGLTDSIILGGDSAGGNLVLATLAYLQDSSLLQLPGQKGMPQSAAAVASSPQPPPPVPLAAVLMSPAVDFRSSSVFGPALAAHFAQGSGKQRSKKHKKQKQPGVPAAQQPDLSCWDYITVSEGPGVASEYVCAQSEADMGLPLVSPALLPRVKDLVQQEMLVMSGGVEVMAPDIAAFAKAAQQAGVALRVHVEPNEPHVYCVLPFQRVLDKGARVLVPFIASCVSKGRKE